MNCTHPREDLILLFYDELDPTHRREVEARLEHCGACRSEWTLLSALSERVPRQPLVDITDAELEHIRRATDDRIGAARQPGQSRPVLFRMPVWQMAVAAVIAIVAFGLGRLTQAPDGSGSALESARVNDVSFDSQTGMVQVAYETVRPATLAGTVDDADIQRLLGQALHSDSPPLSRMRAARALAESHIRPGADIVSALEGILASDPNAATRLQALKALQQLHEHAPVSESLRSTLLDLVVNEPNTAIRMRALDTVTRSELVTMDMAYALEAASRDQNPHIRRQASMALVDMETTQALETLN